MKKSSGIIFLLCVLTLLPSFHSIKASETSSRLKGKILLQVESNGEAWYVNPDNEKRYFLGRPDDAFRVMRELGLGISNKDFDSFGGTAPKRLSGKILIKVEDSGRAYYVNPGDLKLHFLGRPADAFQIMRKLGLGISNRDLGKILEKGEIDTSNLKILSNSEIINKLKDSVVYIETENGAGSGFIIESTGYILTNAHVVNDVSTANIILSDNTSINAKVVGRDENIDIALLKINKTGLKNSSIGDSDGVKQGDEIFTLGYPFGIKGDVSFKDGTISRSLTDSQNKYFEISAEIHPGNSGGPLVNRYGQVVGINTATFGQNIQGLSIGESIKLAIPINVAIELLPKLKSGINRIADTQNDQSAIINSSEGVPPLSAIDNLSIVDSWYENYSFGNIDSTLRISAGELKIMGIIKNESKNKNATNIKIKVTLEDSETGIKQEEVVDLESHKTSLCFRECELIVLPLQNSQFKEKINIYAPFLVKSGYDESLKSTVSVKTSLISAEWSDAESSERIILPQIK